MYPKHVHPLHFLSKHSNPRRLDLGEVAARARLLELEPKHTGDSVLLSNLYASECRWTDVQIVRPSMLKEGLRKTPGHGLVELGNCVYDFIMGDSSHSESKKIYEKLEEITSLLKLEGYVPHTTNVLADIENEEKETALSYHSEKIAIAFMPISTPPRTPIRVVKNLSVRANCNLAIKLISKPSNDLRSCSESALFRSWRAAFTLDCVSPPPYFLSLCFAAQLEHITSRLFLAAKDALSSFLNFSFSLIGSLGFWSLGHLSSVLHRLSSGRRLKARVSTFPSAHLPNRNTTWWHSAFPFRIFLYFPVTQGHERFDGFDETNIRIILLLIHAVDSIAEQAIFNALDFYPAGIFLKGLSDAAKRLPFWRTLKFLYAHLRQKALKLLATVPLIP
ncbi:DYW domain [Dillenia turbinata]|uniref:DYW domain n=1 Tax=Dillenia turbinata TaxID=194707 RepID=A0AAN8YY15_9MAGN